MRPELSLVGSFYHNYINQVPDNELSEAFEKQSASLFRFLETIPPDKYDYRYADGKWTLKELLQHIIDAERIFAYRALSFARKEPASLPSFDENTYADNSFANERTWKSLTEELKAVRGTTEILFSSFNTEMLNYSGIANNNPVTVNAIG